MSSAASGRAEGRHFLKVCRIFPEGRIKAFDTVYFDEFPATREALYALLAYKYHWDRSEATQEDTGIFVVPWDPEDESDDPIVVWKSYSDYVNISMAYDFSKLGGSKKLKDISAAYENGLPSGARIVVVLPRAVTGVAGVAQAAGAVLPQGVPIQGVAAAAAAAPAAGEAPGVAAGPEPIPDDVAAFINSARNSDISLLDTKKPGAMEVLDANLYDFVVGRIYLRDFFYPLIMSVLSISTNAIAPNALIIGTPGIGKSVFGIVLLWAVLALGQNCAYWNQQTGHCGFIVIRGADGKDHIQWFANFDSFRAATRKLGKDDVVISDSVDPKAKSGWGPRVILITSPKYEIWKDFVKNKRRLVTGERIEPEVTPSRYVIPTFSEVELARMVGLECIAPVPPNWRELYSLYGGVPRHVFEPKNNRDSWAAAVDNASKVRLDILESLVDGPGAKISGRDVDLIPDMCLHFMTEGQAAAAEARDPPLTADEPEFFRFCRVVYASKQTEELLAKMLAEKRSLMVDKFIDRASDTPGLSGLLGSLFERRVIGSLCDTSVLTWKCRPLFNPQAPASFTVEKKHDEVIFNDLASLAAFSDPEKREAKLLRPKAANFGAVDVILGNVGLVQITLSSTHTINLDKLVEVLQTLGLDREGGDIPFYFIVPSDAFASGYRAPQAFIKDRKQVTAKDAIDQFPFLSRLKQYVVCFPRHPDVLAGEKRPRDASQHATPEGQPDAKRRA